MVDLPEEIFDGPIPGAAMTAELGARPWQQPPQYATVDEALEFYLSALTDEDNAQQLLDLLEMGLPVTMIANTLNTTNVMQGKHTIDVGVLILPIIMEIIMYVADKEGVKYETGLEKGKGVRESLINKLMARLEEEDESPEPIPQEINENIKEDSMAKPMGLMAREQ